MSFRLVLLGLLGVVVASALAAEARAEGACEGDHLRAQRARGEGHLVEATEALLLCSAKTCPNLVQQDCTTWLAEVKADTPTIVLDARDERGVAVKTTSVRIDGKDVARGVDGTAIEVNPGEHDVVFTADGLAPVTVRVLAKAGAKNEPVVATFRAEPAPRGAGKLPAFILFGVAGASLATFGALAIAGQVEYDGFDACKPRCPVDDVDRVQREFIAADVMLGVTAAALGTAIVLSFTLPSSPAKPAAAALGLELSF